MKKLKNKSLIYEMTYKHKSKNIISYTMSFIAKKPFVIQSFTNISYKFCSNNLYYLDVSCLANCVIALEKSPDNTVIHKNMVINFFNNVLE